MLFCSDDDCYKYLASLKWQEDKFVCKKCGNTTYHKGRSPYSRRCNKCKYDESVTAGTMFEKLKFPILIAFNIIAEVPPYATPISTIFFGFTFLTIPLTNLLYTFASGSYS